MMRPAIVCLLASAALAADQPVDPTFLRLNLGHVSPQPDDLSAPGCHYRPLFGAGAGNSRIVRGVARFGEVRLDPGSASALVRYDGEEQVYVVTGGSGQVVYAGSKEPVREGDFLYLPPGVEHGLANTSEAPLAVIVMGFKIPKGASLRIPQTLQIANIGEVKKQVVGNHPPSTLYQLLMGDTRSTRDRIAAGHVLTSLFIMEIAPGGTNHPHHHDREEEIYLLLEGEGDMVAGGGLTGVEGRHLARPGDAYFFRLNATVGFYNTGARTARILAVRSLYPFGGR